MVAKDGALALGVIMILIFAVMAGLYYFDLGLTPKSGPYFLELHVSAGSPASAAVRAVQVVEWEYNPLNVTNSVVVLPKWSEVLGITGEGCISGWPMGVGLLKGYYVEGNVSRGRLVPYPFMFSCPAALIVLQSLAFFPRSSTAVATTNFGTPTWDMRQTLTYQSLAAGEYTVVACDEWGHLAFAYFSVAA